MKDSNGFSSFSFLTTIRQFSGRLTCALLVIFLTQGCSQKTGEQKASEKIEYTKFLFPPEAAEFVDDLVAKIDSASIHAGNGAIVKLVPTRAEGMSATNRLASGEVKPALWLAPASYIVDATRDRLAPLSTDFVECQPLFSSKEVLTNRIADSFDLEKFGDSTELKGLLEIDGTDGTLVPSFIVGIPGTSASGMSTLLAFASTVTGKKLPDMSARLLRDALFKLERTQQHVVQYMASDNEMLQRLDKQEGGQPLLALTTDQQFKAYAANNPDSHLQMRNLTDVALVNDFPLCIVSAPWLSLEEQDAARKIQQFMLNEDIKPLWHKAGFSPPVTSTLEKDKVHAIVESTFFLFDHWADIRKPLALTIAVDTSSTMENLKLETVKRDLSLFFSTSDRGSSRGPTALLSFSNTPEIVLDFSTDSLQLRTAVDRLRSSGGSSFRDSVLKAIDIFNESAYADHRRAIFVITDGKDTSSKTPSNQFATLVEQLLSRKRIFLYVMAIGSTREEFGDIPDLIESVGGTFKFAPPEQISAEMIQLWRELR